MCVPRKYRIVKTRYCTYYVDKRKVLVQKVSGASASVDVCGHNSSVGKPCCIDFVLTCQKRHLFRRERNSGIKYENDYYLYALHETGLCEYQYSVRFLRQGHSLLTKGFQLREYADIKGSCLIVSNNIIFLVDESGKSIIVLLAPSVAKLPRQQRIGPNKKIISGPQQLKQDEKIVDISVRFPPYGKSNSELAWILVLTDKHRCFMRHVDTAQWQLLDQKPSEWTHIGNDIYGITHDAITEIVDGKRPTVPLGVLLSKNSIITIYENGQYRLQRKIPVIVKAKANLLSDIYTFFFIVDGKICCFDRKKERFITLNTSKKVATVFCSGRGKHSFRLYYVPKNFSQSLSEGVEPFCIKKWELDGRVEEEKLEGIYLPPPPPPFAEMDQRERHSFIRTQAEKGPEESSCFEQKQLIKMKFSDGSVHKVPRSFLY